nr:MAG: iron-dependent repressor [Bacteroidota bacterium]
MLSLVEENYLKAIYHLSDAGKSAVSTNALADNMNNKAASVTDMIKRLSSKGVISYEKYRGVNISEKGRRAALKVIRKHRLWETFLVEKLNFNWDEVHEVAEQLEHIDSPLLIEKLDSFLGHPKVDPHGHPIPDKDGRIHEVKQVQLSEAKEGTTGILHSVNDGSPKFLQYLSKIGIRIGARIEIVERMEFDGSMEIIIDDKERVFISRQASENLLIRESHEKR